MNLQRKGVCGKKRVLGEIIRKVLMTGKQDQKGKKTCIRKRLLGKRKLEGEK